MTIKNRLQTLRQQMREQQLDYYFVSNSDPHQNEYLPERWQRYQYISGFTGSNAEILIGLEQAYFFTDGRYIEQAKFEIDPTLFKTHIIAQGSGTGVNALIQTETRNSRIGIDPTTITVTKMQGLQHAAQAANAELVFLQDNLIDCSRDHLPPLPHQPIMVYPDNYAGETANHKIKRLRKLLAQQHYDALVLTDLSCIAWLLNLRGTDIDHNPIFLSYAVISQDTLLLYVQPESLNPEVEAYLANLNVTLKPYHTFYQTLAQLPCNKVLLDPKTSNQAVLEALNQHTLYLEPNPLELWKACKNTTEITGARKAHEIDAIALIRFFAWLDQNKTGHTEISLTEKLLTFRKQDSRFRATSFSTIAGYKDHGAIIHYHATPSTDAAIGQDALFLLDSGAQYLDGTTDVTRTVHLGTPSAFERQCYTLVLKGHLALRQAIFPAGTRGEQLDTFARQFIWREGFNYGHGTGHGVGAYLCVHEGPQRISTGTTATSLMPNMIVSNEPGLYLPNQFGIRIENLIFVKPAAIKDSGFGEFYTFEDLTLVPYALNLIEISLLTAAEIMAINAYHQKIWDTLHNQLDESDRIWLKAATQAIQA